MSATNDKEVSRKKRKVNDVVRGIKANLQTKMKKTLEKIE